MGCLPFPFLHGRDGPRPSSVTPRVATSEPELGLEGDDLGPQVLVLFLEILNPRVLLLDLLQPRSGVGITRIKFLPVGNL